ncbi:hypothetical protein SK128_010273, partial [Halocaridina rubra]
MVISLDDKIRNMDGEMKENETLREQIRSLEEANKAQGQERKELEKRIKKLEGEKSQLESRISKQEDKNKQLNDNLKELDYGLYSAFVGCFVYMFFGSTMEVNIGPTAIMALMTLQYTSHGGPDFAVLLCFISGIIELAAGIINLGFLINFISQPVISGFTSAAAITIASSQLKPLFGLQVKTKGLLDTWINVAKNLADVRWQDATLGITCIVILSFMK